MTSRRIDAFLALVAAAVLTGTTTARPTSPRFIAHTIATGLSEGYQVVVSDLNRDGKADIEDRWARQVLDDGGMAAAGCAVADLNGDKRPDVVCIGTATANVKWYENRR